MNILNIETKLKKIYNDIKIIQENNKRFKIFTHITFKDGDHIICILKKIKNDWYISDEGSIYMHLKNEPDIEKLTQILLTFNLMQKNGEIIINIKNNISKAFSNFIDGTSKIIENFS